MLLAAIEKVLSLIVHCENIGSSLDKYRRDLICIGVYLLERVLAIMVVGQYVSVFYRDGNESVPLFDVGKSNL